MSSRTSYLLTSITCLLIGLAGLALMACTAPFTRISECRHRAVECALVYGEKGAKVALASGPVEADPKQWHSQTYLLPPNQVDLSKPWKWLVNEGFQCSIGDQEPFIPHRYDTVAQYLDWQFSWVD